MQELSNRLQSFADNIIAGLHSGKPSVCEPSNSFGPPLEFPALASGGFLIFPSKCLGLRAGAHVNTLIQPIRLFVGHVPHGFLF